MSVTRISTNVAAMVEFELENQSIDGEDIHWDVTVLPGDEKAPILFITVGIAGAVLGTKVQVGVFLANPVYLGPTDIKDAIAALLEVVRRQRSEQLPRNSGLLLPGGS